MQPSSPQIDELDLFLASLGRRIARLAESGRVLDGDEDHPPRFMDYARARNLTSECMAFMIVIDRRIDDLAEEGLRSRYRNVFEQHTITLWATLLGCSLTFLRAISAQEHLPLGSREVFVREIKTLHDAHGTLSQERFSGKVTDDILAKQLQAQKILNEIIERAPRLLDLG